MAQSKGLDVIAFDADDTLWHNEENFRRAEQALAELLAEFATPAEVHEAVMDAERRNLVLYGYGSKGFALSMIQTAIAISCGRVSATLISRIIDIGRGMLSGPLRMLPSARQAVETLSKEFTVVMISKGDLHEQEQKVAQSGMRELFDGIEIVSEKTPQVYRRVFQKYGDGPQSSMMVGNSIKSDVAPALEAGGWGVHVPHELEWELDRAPPPRSHPRFRQLTRITDVVPLVQQIHARVDVHTVDPVSESEQ